MAKEKAKTPAHGTAIAPPPETMAMEVSDFDFTGDEGAGFDNQTMADRKLPIFQLLQSNSPKVVESRGKIFPGQWLNSVTGEVHDELEVVAAITDQTFVSYVPRDDGGGFRGKYAPNSKTVLEAIKRNDGKAFGKLPFPQPPDPKTQKPQPTQELVETFEIYAIICKGREIVGFGMIPCASMKITPYRDWNSQLTMFAPLIISKDKDGKEIGRKQFKMGEIPLFAHRVRLTSVSDTNPKGTFMKPVFSPINGGDDLKLSMIGQKDSRYQAAKKLREDVMKGSARAAYETMENEPGADPENHAPF